ncbi:MAG TPA: hypothetical protein VLK25_03235 [Allosphingosinicella sp.]|nr:hypothetical protein [Allosphingosinicella sp.]
MTAPPEPRRPHARSLLRCLALGLVLACHAPAVATSQAAAAPPGAERDGRRDFDFETGTWDTHVRLLRNPLSGATPDWAEYRGTSIVRPLMDGRANVVELSVAGPAGRIEGLSLRLYNPQTHQWSLNYAGLRSGSLTAPVHGRFDGAGGASFYGTDMVEGRAVFVRFVISEVTANSARFEQAFSVDGGATWEVNWIAVDTRRR